MRFVDYICTCNSRSFSPVLPSPVLSLVLSCATMRFVYCLLALRQNDPSNWYHPLGFALHPEDAGKNLGDTLGAQYFITGQAYPLGVYVSFFKYPRAEWLQTASFAGGSTITLTITDPNIREIFYYCHVHNAMVGRILINGSRSDAPLIPLARPEVPSGYDAVCGTADTARYYPDSQPSLCGNDTFLCYGEGEGVDARGLQFARCMEAIDCRMHYGMHVKLTPNDPVATFMHQMIPHHLNAVNMARILLKAMGEQNLEPEVVDLMYTIINEQNAQVTDMKAWLTSHNYGNYSSVNCMET
eukprot:jgi/Mesvir1/6854/Mv26571-RA.1